LNNLYLYARRSPLLSLAVLFLLLSPFTIYSQKVSSIDRQRSHEMLKGVKHDLQKHYYDPNYRGMNLDERFKQAEEKLKSAESLGQMFGVIAQVLIELNDSHTFFLPPQRYYKTEYGYRMQMIGDGCYITAVKPGSDAQTSGLKPGDRVFSVNGFETSREHLWKIDYMFNALRPQPALMLEIQSPGSKEIRKLPINAKIDKGKINIDLSGESGDADLWDLIRESENEKRLYAHQTVEVGQDTVIWKMPGFDLEPSKVDQYMNSLKKTNLIIDLRGNGGGYEDMMLRLIGHFFPKDITVGEIKRRKESKVLIAKSKGPKAFTGKLIVLVDSQSGSASEVFARVIQLEKRGTVIGDTTAGAVMRSRQFQHSLGANTMVFYGTSITDADFIMTDGKTLEHTGVIPDKLVLPKAEDLASNRDTVLSYAASLLGVDLSPNEATKLFPVVWGK
jgi:carboxyl-terminal processing protease